MTRIIKSKYKSSRRLGVAIWGTSKDAFNRKNYRPGQHGADRSNEGGISNYGLHLKVKQRIKAYYGFIKEKQLKKIFFIAQRKKGNTADNFISLLESRLDSIVYRLGLAPSIFAAKQMINHKHVKVNGNVVNICSQRLNIEDVIELTDHAKNVLYKEEQRKAPKNIPSYLELNTESVCGKFLRIPLVNDVPFPFDPQISKLVEFYSY